MSQNRLREKSTLRAAGLPVTPFEPVRSLDDLNAAIGQLGTPAVLKTAAWGYDGKGQIRIDSPGDSKKAWELLASDELILEQMIPFERELSVVAARGVGGELVCFAPFENEHRDHILDVSRLPSTRLRLTAG